MRITIRDQSLARDLILIFLTPLLATASAYAWLACHDSGMAIALGSGAVGAILLAFLLSKARPLIVIDENGVFDRRLGIGRIAWSDIEGVLIDASYGNRFLCLSVRDPQRYLSRLRGGAKRKALASHELGFRKFSIDFRDANLDLVDLKRIMDRRIAG